jgi:effector-binding domain-containing protein
LERLTIGQFSKVCWLSVKALRLYDELELLQPAFVDPSSGYRYYEISQAPKARAIAILRSLDMPLPQIKEVLSESDTEKLRARLEDHRAVLADRLMAHQHMLRRVEQLMKRGELMSYEIKIKEVEPATVTGMTFDVTADTIGPESGRAYQRIYEILGQEGVNPVAPPRLLYHEMNDDAWKIETCVPIGGSAPKNEELTTYEAPGGRAVTTLHVGPYDELGIAWNELRREVSSKGYETTGAPYDLYLNDPNEVRDPTKFETELVWPIA